MNDPERAMLLSVHPRFATAILAGSKTVEVAANASPRLPERLFGRIEPALGTV